METMKTRKIELYANGVEIQNGDHRIAKEILIGIDTKTNHIYNLIEVGKNGTRTTLTVTSFKFNQKLGKNQFTFVKAKYPNYYKYQLFHR